MSGFDRQYLRHPFSAASIALVLPYMHAAAAAVRRRGTRGRGREQRLARGIAAPPMLSICFLYIRVHLSLLLKTFAICSDNSSGGCREPTDSLRQLNKTRTRNRTKKHYGQEQKRKQRKLRQKHRVSVLLPFCRVYHALSKLTHHDASTARYHLKTCKHHPTLSNVELCGHCRKMQRREP